METRPEDSRERETSGSDRTLNMDHDNRKENKEQEDGGEKGNGGDSKPVGFWHKSLDKPRKKVFARWAVLSEPPGILTLTAY